jgi:hypothetical protein
MAQGDPTGQYQAGMSLTATYCAELESQDLLGGSIFKMIDVSRHKPVDTLRGCVRDADLFKELAGAGSL